MEYQILNQFILHFPNFKLYGYDMNKIFKILSIEYKIDKL